MHAWIISLILKKKSFNNTHCFIFAFINIMFKQDQIEMFIKINSINQNL